MNATPWTHLRVMKLPRRLPRCARRGLTLIEVLVAAVILSIAALAALDLLAATDAASLAARRIALASIEAERALITAAAAVHDGRDAATRWTLDGEGAGEALASCSVEVRATRELCSVTRADGNAVRLPMIRLIAQVTGPDGVAIATLERISALPNTGGAP
jgi:prepilin-type N-terminal cleavage/methylation domain-containing protein